MSNVTTLRRIPAPVTEPPFDDEIGPIITRLRASTFYRDAPAVGTQGTLALSFTLPSGLPAIPQAFPLRVAVRDFDPDFAPRPTPRNDLPEPSKWAGQLVQAVLEVITGDRPSTQLVRWTTADIYADIREATRTFWESAAAPLRSVGRGARQTRVSVRSVHVCEPRNGIAEVSATVQRGSRVSAVALRLEGIDGRWQCTALQLG